MFTLVRGLPLCTKVAKICRKLPMIVLMDYQNTRCKHMLIKKWQEAFDLLVSSKVIYSKISGFKDSLEAVIYQEKIG
jgi:hypothetical protein